jgi:hypothetical protein
MIDDRYFIKNKNKVLDTCGNVNWLEVAVHMVAIIKGETKWDISGVNLATGYDVASILTHLVDTNKLDQQYVPQDRLDYVAAMVVNAPNARYLCLPIITLGGVFSSSLSKRKTAFATVWHELAHIYDINTQSLNFGDDFDRFSAQCETHALIMWREYFAEREAFKMLPNTGPHLQSLHGRLKSTSKVIKDCIIELAYNQRLLFRYIGRIWCSYCYSP